MELETQTEKKNAKDKIDETREKPQAQQQQQRMGDGANKKRKHKEVFPFGNYRNYYGYRIDSDSEEDPRLKVMKKEWFQGKDCLDIGCNSGIMTIHIAKKFKCRSILGIDIDRNRVEDASWHLRNFLRKQPAECSKTKKHRSELADKDNSSENQNSIFSKEEMKENSRLDDLSQIVSFRTENFVQSKSHEANCYDTILCLSVAKWIHLNWGDDGLITLFSKVWKLLRPGGIFVLEPQPWKSYENNRRVSEIAATNYRKIIFRPNQFRDILLDKIGFTSVEDLTSGLSGTKAGFDRPIFAYQK